MTQNCPEYLNLITDVLRDGMTFAMSVWTDNSRDGALDWLQHGICDQRLSNPCGSPDLKFRNFKFTTKDGSSSSGGGSTGGDSNGGGSTGGGSNGGGSTGGGSTGGGSTGGSGGSASMTDIAAAFANIRANPHYSSTNLSRTLYQVDQSFDLIEQQLISMQAALT